MSRATPSEHCVFLLRAWRATPDSPWEFVLHRSGTSQSDYVRNQSELLTALNRQLHDDRLHVCVPVASELMADTNNGCRHQ